MWNCRWKGNSSNYNNGIKQNSVELTSLVKMVLNMQQQITIASWAITYKDREVARREFNVALQPSTVGKWRKRLVETGRMQKIKPPGRPHISTEAKQLRELWRRSTLVHKNQPAKLHVSFISVNQVCVVFWSVRSTTPSPIRVHEEEAPLNGQPVPLTSQHVTIGCGVIEGEGLCPEISRRRHADISDWERN